MWRGADDAAAGPGSGVAKRQSHVRMAADHTPRDSARYSIVAPEWPAAKQRLVLLRDRRHADA